MPSFVSLPEIAPSRKWVAPSTLVPAVSAFSKSIGGEDEDAEVGEGTLGRREQSTHLERRAGHTS